MSLAFGPFAQQAVTYPLRLRPDPSGDARAARAQNYTVVRGLGLGAQNFGIPDPTMKSAIYTGLFLNDNDTIPSLVPTCSTGNCTWPTYLTLGLCARVADVTNLLEYRCNDTSTIKECNYTLPNGLSLMEYNGQNMVISTAQEDNPTLSFPGPNVPILDLFIINTDLNFTGSNTTEGTNNFET
ncbi:hypothetical protein H2200_003445 [Cladophialophora chaetospira]|uniref:Uncharacterized protein n=1 Tax=Cladophialophora chaetospira TaxID=386627 RepID=A0AA39CMR5_9EURO|nr:hypothetical protein H2200_003445 [Cladophialophora chaetospira]